MQDIEAICDMMFGSSVDVITLIKAGDWEKAAGFGDGVCYRAVTNNEDWIWGQLTKPSGSADQWNSCSWGNYAIGIHYGANFPNRTEQVKKLKTEIQALALKQ